MVSQRRLKLTIAYDGSAYHGWQRQPQYASIQQTLEETLATIAQQKTVVVGSGRTDSGVHALEQVAHCDVKMRLDNTELTKALNAMLPKDIVIKKIDTMAADFHAQRHVTTKTYRYQILNTPLRAPLLQYDHWWVPKKLSVSKMHEAAQCIVGEHDFKSFQTQGTPVDSTVRSIQASVFKESGERIIYEVTGKGFLRHMVRNLVGAYVRVGHGALSVEAFEQILKVKDRRQAPPPAPPQGLTLATVRYSEQFIDNPPSVE